MQSESNPFTFFVKSRLHSFASFFLKSVSRFSLNRVCRSSHGRWNRMISAASPYPSSQAIPTHSSRCSRHGKSPAQVWLENVVPYFISVCWFILIEGVAVAL
ncbi:hypothetical protein F2Q69_00007919 [Brassica cretica]|uniref:Uncharacterized protein n=1 Tax=Brassica cretica TaxID=69181 RepID=A0A8S9NTK1_BRACR|nr:hypothetical protein F2Q69_00007919 [Brassica cretica]